MKSMFLSVGAMKAGTTLLFNILRQHPDIFFTPEKEVHYFAHIYGLSPFLAAPLTPNNSNSVVGGLHNPMVGKILSNNFRRNRLAAVMRGRFSKIEDVDKLRKITLWYAESYLTNPVDASWFERIFEESLGQYNSDFSNYHALLSPTAWNDIRTNLKGGSLKVLYVMRNPVDRIWSHFKFDSLYSGKTELIENFSLTEAKKLVANSSISPHSRYGDIVENLINSLHQDELKIIYFEDFLSRPESILREIENFLNLEHYSYAYDLARKINASTTTELDTASREFLLKNLTPQIDKIRKLNFEIPDSYFN